MLAAMLRPWMVRLAPRSPVVPRKIRYCRERHRLGRIDGIGRALGPGDERRVRRQVASSGKRARAIEHNPVGGVEQEILIARNRDSGCFRDGSFPHRSSDRRRESRRGGGERSKDFRTTRPSRG